MTFDILAATKAKPGFRDWEDRFEAFSQCRKCKATSIFVLQIKRYEYAPIFKDPKVILTKNNVDQYFDIIGYVSLKDNANHTPPDYIPENIKNAFIEGSTCISVRCWNAASTMFRLCLDLATRPLLPNEDYEGTKPNSRERRDLGLRIPWLIKNSRLPAELSEFAKTVREDGNDGAHNGDLVEADAIDLLDFTTLLLERLFTEPGRLAAAEARRIERRAKQ